VEAFETGSTGQPDLEALVRLLPPERRDPVRSFVGELLGPCPYCGAEVCRDSPRGLDADERLGCLACVGAVVGTCSLCHAEVTRKHKRQELPNGAIAHRTCVEKRGR
jgi:hypothetical protein